MMGPFLLVSTVLVLGCYSDSLKRYEQPYNVHDGSYDDISKNAEHICTRECKPNDRKICYYRFVCEPYTSMNGACGNCPNNATDCEAKQCVTADCFERSILCINRMIPAPSIQVCKGDIVIVDVKNGMSGRSISIHWHGLRQINAKFMDGVPMVTQCPIMEGEIFRYHYKADYPGSHFYHSHGGLQKVDGIVGCLVIRHWKGHDPNRDLYDFDLPSFCIVIQDWKPECADCLFPGHITGRLDQEADTYLIQGKGNRNNTNCPLHKIHVRQGYRYVLRIVGGTCFTCQYVFMIEKHWLTIIGTDGQPTKPYKVRSLTMSPGERFTVVIECNQRKDTYWMIVRGVGSCANKLAYQLGQLIYQGHSGPPSTPQPGPVADPVVEIIHPTVNPNGTNCTKANEKDLGPCIADLEGAYPTHKELYGYPHKRIILAMGFHTFKDKKPFEKGHEYAKHNVPGPFGVFSSTINGIAYDVSPCPLLSQWREVPEHLLCQEDANVTAWNTVARECVHVIKVPANRMIELVICDTRNFALEHPFHLHGYDYCVVSQGKFPNPGGNFRENLDWLTKKLDSTKNPVKAYCPLKDTIALTTGGWVVARIYTDNPGFWYFHCHFAYHLESGMAGVLQVGEKSQFPKPPLGFPRCGDYLPLMKECEDRCN